MKTSCIPCPNGTFTVSRGAKSLAECGGKCFIPPLFVVVVVAIVQSSFHLSVEK